MIVYKPKGDFEQSIGIQEQYVTLLKTYYAELMMKAQKSKGYQLSKYRVELHELSTKLDLQISLLEEKKSNFNEYFIPSYNKELEECESKYDEIWLEACKYVNFNDNDITNKMKFAMDSLMEQDEENRKHIEVKNVVYKDLKTLLSLVENKD
tara:strand:+ start:926 stop:1381 length:456 start_codon:yes stop_codon:yes gene_type:complete